MEWSKAKEIILKNKEVQDELKMNEAELIGTRQSNISRLESGNYNPTLDFLQKIASAMGKKLEVRII